MSVQRLLIKIKKIIITVTLKAFYDDIELELGLDDRVVNYKDEYSYLKELFNDYLKKKILF